MEARRARARVPTEWYTILTIAGKKPGYRARPGWCQEGDRHRHKQQTASSLPEMIMTHHFAQSPGLIESSQKSWELGIIIPVSRKEKLRLSSVT